MKQPHVALDVELKMRCDDGWCVIERAVHDGRMWLEPIGLGAMGLRCSSRLTGADIEGPPEEMLAIAEAIERRESVSFKRCRARLVDDGYALMSPRNDVESVTVSFASADALARSIREALGEGERIFTCERDKWLRDKEGSR